MPRVLVTPSGLLINADFQLFMKFVDHFVDLKSKNSAILTSFYRGEFNFTKIWYSFMSSNSILYRI